MNVFRSASVLALAFAAFAASAQTIDTYPSWDGVNFGFPFGNPDTVTYGQSITAPSTSTFASYTTSFAYNSGTPFTFQMYLAAWNPTTLTITGPILYSSSVVTSPASGAGYVAYTFTPNVAVTSGTTYMAFTSTLGQAVQAVGGARQGKTTTDAYAGGNAYYLNAASGGTSFSSLSTIAWNDYGNDYAFRATFVPTVTPEPSALAALGLGLVAVVRRRKRA